MRIKDNLQTQYTMQIVTSKTPPRPQSTKPSTMRNARVLITPKHRSPPRMWKKKEELQLETQSRPRLLDASRSQGGLQVPLERVDVFGSHHGVMGAVNVVESWLAPREIRPLAELVVDPVLLVLRHAS